MCYMLGQQTFTIQYNKPSFKFKCNLRKQLVKSANIELNKKKGNKLYIRSNQATATYFVFCEYEMNRIHV